MTQAEELSLFFEFCKEFGILNANEFPTVTQIPEEDVQELERIINGVSDKTHKDEDLKEKNQMAMVVRENNANVEQKVNKGALTTTITDKWVVFDEILKIKEENNCFSNEKKTVAEEAAARDLPLVSIDHVPVYNHYKIPDLISF